MCDVRVLGVHLIAAIVESGLTGASVRAPTRPALEMPLAYSCIPSRIDGYMRLDELHPTMHVRGTVWTDGAAAIGTATRASLGTSRKKRIYAT